MAETSHTAGPSAQEATPHAPAQASEWLFGNTAFLKLFFGSLSGKLGERIYQMAAIVSVMLAFADSTRAIALITLIGVVPQFLLYPLIGRVVDAYDRRRLLWLSMALSVGLVFGFAPVFMLQPNSPEFAERWMACLPVIFILSTVIVPFGPARASAIPDVVSVEQTGLAASLIATTGLVAILLGSVLGGVLALYFGSLKAIPVSAGLYALSALLMSRLPDAVAVPGTQRKAQGGTGSSVEAETKPPRDRGGISALPPAEGKITAFVQGNWEGLKYSVRKKGVVALILFETTFWLCAVAFYNLCPWHAALVLQLPPDTKVLYFSLGLGCAGVGLFAGALAVGRWCRTISPLVTYPLGYFLIGFAIWSIFSSHAWDVPAGGANPAGEYRRALERFVTQVYPKALPDGQRDAFLARAEAQPLTPERLRELALELAPQLPSAEQAELERLLPELTVEALRDVEEKPAARDRVNARLAFGLFPFLFLLGLGGGLLLGRVDADLLEITAESMRGRVFSLKAFFFTAALIVPLLVFLLDPRFDTRWDIAYFMPFGLMLMALPVLPLAWMLDVGIYANPKRLNPGGPVERAAFYTARFLSWLIAKLYFRLSIEGHEKVPTSGAVMLVANHASFLDPIWLGDSMKRRVQYMMHSSYYYSAAHPFYRFMMCIPVDQTSQIRALKEGSKALAQGICMGMFPEGTVTRTGQMGKPKLGAAFLAQRAGAVVVPCAIDGNLRAFPRQRKFPKPVKITIRVGTPFAIPKDAPREEVARLLDNAMAEIAKLINVEPPPKCADDFKDRKRGKAGEVKTNGEEEQSAEGGVAEKSKEPEGGAA